MILDQRKFVNAPDWGYAPTRFEPCRYLTCIQGEKFEVTFRPHWRSYLARDHEGRLTRRRPWVIYVMKNRRNWRCKWGDPYWFLDEAPYDEDHAYCEPVLNQFLTHLIKESL